MFIQRNACEAITAEHVLNNRKEEVKLYMADPPWKTSCQKVYHLLSLCTHHLPYRRPTKMQIMSPTIVTQCIQRILAAFIDVKEKTRPFVQVKYFCQVAQVSVWLWPNSNSLETQSKGPTSEGGRVMEAAPGRQ